MNNKRAITGLALSIVGIFWLSAPALANGDSVPVVARENVEKLTYEERMTELDKQIALAKKKLEKLELEKKISKLKDTVTYDGNMVISSNKKTDPIEKMAVHSVYEKETGKGMDAEIRYGGSMIPVKTGDKLPGNWRVTLIDAGGVKVKRGKNTRVIPVMEEDEPEMMIPPAPVMQLTPPPGLQ